MIREGTVRFFALKGCINNNQHANETTTLFHKRNNFSRMEFQPAVKKQSTNVTIALYNADSIAFNGLL